jgi:hypothetical protein
MTPQGEGVNFAPVVDYSSSSDSETDDERPLRRHPNPLDQPTMVDVVVKYAIGGVLIVSGIALIAYFGPKMIKGGVEMVQTANDNLSMVLKPQRGKLKL